MFGAPLNQQDADHEAATLQKMELDRGGRGFAGWVEQTAIEHGEAYRRELAELDAQQSVEAREALALDRQQERAVLVPPAQWERNALAEIDESFRKWLAEYVEKKGGTA